jgi:two-component system, NarL family, response regulator NreC
MKTSVTVNRFNVMKKNPSLIKRNGKIRVMIVEDHEMFRDGMGIILSQIENFELAAAVATGREMKRVLKEDGDVQVVLMDVKLQGENGIELTEYIREYHPDVFVIALTMNEDPNTILRMLSAGASGYLLKNASKNDLRDAIDAVLNGNEYYSPEAAFQVINKISTKEKTNVAGVELGGFSMREVQIIRMVCEGKSNQEIADKLFLSTRTVEKHRFNIMKRMQVKSAAELVVYAIKHNLYEA